MGVRAGSAEQLKPIGMSPESHPQARQLMSSVPRPGAGCCVCRIRPCHAGKHPLGDSVPLARCGQAVMGGEVAAAQGYSRCGTVGFSMARTSKQRGWQDWGARGGGCRPRARTPSPRWGLSAPLHAEPVGDFPMGGLRGGIWGAGSSMGAVWPQQARGCVGGVKPPPAASWSRRSTSGCRRPRLCPSAAVQLRLPIPGEPQLGG